MILDLRTIARALGGEVQGRQVLAPGPNHSRRDRSLSIRISADAPGGFVVNSFAEDDFAACRDHVGAALGLPSDFWRTRTAGTSRPAPAFIAPEPGPEPDHAARIARAAALWGEGRDPAGTVVERYLARRGLALPERAADALRFHSRCPWKDDPDGATVYVPALIAAMRSVVGDRITAVHRTRLSDDGTKIGRKMLGPSRGAAVKLDGDAEVTAGLAVGEGIETALAARLLGFRPAWAMTSAGAVAALPVLPGIEALILLAERDEASARAVEACAFRWHAAGREVTIIEPTRGCDMADVVGGVA